MSVASTNLEMLRQVAAANSSPPDSGAQPEAPKPKRGRKAGASDELPIEFYNSRYKWERHYDAEHAKRVGHGDIPRYLEFSYGMFTATEPWQVELLRKIPHVFEADLDDVVICRNCGYGTKSLRDYEEHMASHF